MKELNELNLPEDLKYAEDHEWVNLTGDIAKIGISDYAQDQLGDIVFVELPGVGDSFAKGDEFGTLESVKAVSELYMPVGGEITAINEALECSRNGQRRSLRRRLDDRDQGLGCIRNRGPHGQGRLP